MNVHTMQTDFDFSGISLANPGRLQGGTFYSKIKYNDGPFYAQSPKCTTKNGVLITGKKKYCDLLFSHDNALITNWVFDFEKKLKDILHSKGSIWFHNTMDLDDIEYFFNSSLRTYKGNNQLMRTYISTPKNIPVQSSIQVYDENETVRQVEDIQNSKIIAIIYCKGIKFTQNSFQVDIDLKQVMLLEDTPEFSGCMIKRARNVQSLVHAIHNDSHLGNLLVQDDISLTDKNSTHKKDIQEPDEITIVPHTALNDQVEDDQVEDDQVEDDQVEDDQVEDDQVEDDQVEDDQVEDDQVEDDQVEDDQVEDDQVEDDLVEDDQVEDSTTQTIKILSSNEIEPLTVSSLDKSFNPSQHDDCLEEVNVIVENSEPITLKKPNEVYYEIYKEAKRKAKLAQKAAIIAFLEAKNIKKTYMLDELDSGSDDDLDSLSNTSHE